MYQKSLDTLEYKKIIDMLVAETESSLGREFSQSLKPTTDISKIKRAQVYTDQAMKMIVLGGHPPLYGIRDIEPLIKRVQIDGSLMAEDLLAIKSTLDVSKDLKAYVSKIKEEDSLETDISMIERKIKTIYTNERLSDNIDRCIEDAETISDDASSTLCRIRRNISNKEGSIKDRLNSLIRSQTGEKYLQDTIYSIRDGRYVVPVKKGSHSHIPGVIVDTSASGSTLFVEPMGVVNLNNDIRELEIEEKIEIDRILKDLSMQVNEVSYELAPNQQVLQELDFIFAKAKLGRTMRGTIPTLNDQGIINIKQGRHPLLTDDEVVPVDIYLGDEFKTLVITGPNTGGKTVTLKLVGLLTAMAQSGLAIPVDQNSQIGVFDNIYADIGDEQSIEQSLSTFSSHMVNIIDILDRVEDNTLVLFDELGSGTDPTEGSMLAIAILEYLDRYDLRTVATTHYNELKVYALTNDGVENASMEFDIQTLSPTYRVLIGIPGRSNAFEISRRLGLSDDIIDHAASMVETEEVKFEDMLTEIDRDREIIAKERREAELATQRAKNLERRLKRQEENLQKEKDKLLDDAKKEARDILKGARDQSKKILDEIQQVARDSKDIRKVHQAQDTLLRSEREISKDIQSDGLDLRVDGPTEKIKKGDSVSIPSLGQSGTVLTNPDNQDQVQVQVGILKMNLGVDTLIKDDSKSAKSQTQTQTTRTAKRRIREMSPTIDLRGYNIEDAIVELDKYLDDAYLSGLQHIEVIHGKGTGALREGLQEYFRTHSHVASQRLGEFEEGGTGVTVLTLK